MAELYDLESDNYERFVVHQRFKNPAKETANIVNDLAHKNAELLDIGTGSGIVLTEIRAINEDIQLFGMDNSFEVLELARKKGFHSLVKSNLPELPYLNNSFEFVTANFVLSHIKKYEETIKEIGRVLRPKGHFIFTSWAGGQKEYNKLFYNKVIEFISVEEYNEIYSRHLPNESFLEDRDNLTEVLNKHDFKVRNAYTKKYQLDLSLSDYLNCRFNLLVGKHMKKVLSKKLWERFQKEMFDVFEEKVGLAISYEGTVDFYICESIK